MDHDLLNSPVDVICYGKKERYETRAKAIREFHFCICNSEGAEKERYTNIYFDLINTDNKVVSDGEPEYIRKKEKKPFTINDKNTILDLIEKGELGIPNPLIYKNGNLLVNDRDIVKALLKKDGWYAAQYIRSIVENDKELLLIAQNSNKKSDMLGYASEALRNDKNFVLEMINLEPSNLYYASENLKNDIDVVKIALKGDFSEQFDEKRVKESIGIDLLKKLVYGEIEINKENELYKEIRVETSKGEILVSVKEDEEYPGVYVDLVGDNVREDFMIGRCPLAIIEWSPDKDALQTIVYDDGKEEDAGYVISHKNIEKDHSIGDMLNTAKEGTEKTLKTNEPNKQER